MNRKKCLPRQARVEVPPGAATTGAAKVLRAKKPRVDPESRS